MIPNTLPKQYKHGWIEMHTVQPQSPDINISEATRDHLNSERTKNIQRRVLFFVLQEAWSTITEDYLKKLQESLPKRVQHVLKNKGCHTCTNCFFPYILHIYLCLHLFHIFLAKYCELRKSGLLHSTVEMCFVS